MAIKILVIMSIIGGISSGIGGVISAIVKINSKNKLAMLYELTAGIMTGIVCFDMLEEAFSISNVFIVIISVLIGITMIIMLDKLIDNNKINIKNNYSKMSLVIMISMAFHNFIEGIAIGSSFIYSFTLGMIVLISIILHDIPEGIVVGMSSKIDKKGTFKVIYDSVISGVFTGFGAMFGYLIGKVDEVYISICLAIAAGVMLYIVSCDLIPSSKKLTDSKKVYIVYILGILIGAIITNI